jgi:hypothetical protein
VATSLFVTNLEIPIVTTSTIAITNQFGRFDNIDWVNSSYLLGYVGMIFPPSHERLLKFVLTITCQSSVSGDHRKAERYLRPQVHA